MLQIRKTDQPAISKNIQKAAFDRVNVCSGFRKSLRLLILIKPVKMIENWKEMLAKSSLKQKAKTRTKSRFNKLANKLNDRHEKLLSKNCAFKQMTQLNLGQVHIDFDNTCRTFETIINGS